MKRTLVVERRTIMLVHDKWVIVLIVLKQETSITWDLTYPYSNSRHRCVDRQGFAPFIGNKLRQMLSEIPVSLDRHTVKVPRLRETDTGRYLTQYFWWQDSQAIDVPCLRGTGTILCTIISTYLRMFTNIYLLRLLKIWNYLTIECNVWLNLDNFLFFTPHPPSLPIFAIFAIFFQRN